MQIPKPSDSDRGRFQALLPDDPSVEAKPMFGNLGAFVNGNMFVGLYGAAIGVKLDTADADELRRLGGGAFGPMDRPMGGYVSVPDVLSLEEQQSWVRRAFTHVATLPGKKPKTRTTKRRGQTHPTP